MFQLQLAGADAGTSLAIGALQFTKGLSQYLSAADAEVQQAQVHAINANESTYDDEGHCTNFVQRYVVEIVPVTPAVASPTNTSTVVGVPVIGADGIDEDDD